MGRLHEGTSRFLIRRLENHDRRPYAVLATAGHDEGLIEKRSLEVRKVGAGDPLVVFGPRVRLGR